MTRAQARFALACAIVGLAASGYAASVHYHLLYDPRYTSLCDVSATVSCTTVYQSRFSTWRGIPIAIFGGMWFALTALLSLGALVSSSRGLVVSSSRRLVGSSSRPDDGTAESIPGYLFVLSTLALSVVLYLGYASLFVIKAICIVCLITYAAVIGLFLVSGAATSVPMTTLPRRAARDARVLAGSPLAVALLVLFFAGAATTLAFFPRETLSAAGEPIAPAPTQDQRSEFERWYAAQPRVPLIIPADGAKVLVVKFNDFQCPACGQTYTQYKPIFAKYQAERPGAVKLVMKDYPLNRDCNDGLGQTIHPAACDAAVAVRLAPPNKVEALEDWLYSHQPTMTSASVRQAARDVAGVSDFESKYASTLALVKGDAGLGRTLGVKSTPTFFVNGVRLEGGFAPQYFDAAIAYELNRTAK